MNYNLFDQLFRDDLIRNYFISDRQWLYQECTELGDFTASHEDNFSLFGDTLPIEYYIEGLCSDVFGKS